MSAPTWGHETLMLEPTVRFSKHEFVNAIYAIGACRAETLRKLTIHKMG